MNREIKFRAWDKKRKCIYQTGINEKGQSSYEIDGKLQIFENDIVMQYTGLKDKNGKEIYEGDISQFFSFKKGNWGNGTEVRDTHFVLKAIFHEGSFCGEIINYNHSKLDTICEDDILNDYKKYHIGCKMSFIGDIYGNIYENPELLNK